MKLEFDNKHMTKIPIILASILLIIIAGLNPTMGRISREEEEKVEAPDWNKGDEWVYEARIGPNENDTKQMTRRVAKTGIEINPNINNGGEDVKYENTYQVVLEDEQGEEIMNSYYDNNSSSLVYEDKPGAGNLYYHKGRKQFDFPLYVGKEWNQTCEVYKEKEGAYEKDHSEYLSGAVLETNMTEVEAGTFKTYKVNVEMLIKAENSTSRGKTVYYYSPEVKKSVKTEIYEVKKNPNNDELEERRVGTEELIEYEVSEDLREFGLTVKTEGNGTVEVDGKAVEAGWTSKFKDGTNVSIEAIADEGWGLVEFREEEIEDKQGDEINITMDSDKEITAVFEEFDPAFFEVEIDYYNKEIRAGNNLWLGFIITNTGDFEKTKNITFHVGDSVIRRKNVTLGAGEQYTDNFLWKTEPGMHIVAVKSEDDNDAVPIHAKEKNPLPGFTSGLLLTSGIIAALVYRNKKR